MMMIIIPVSFLPTFSNPGPSKRASSPAQKVYTLVPRVRQAILIVICSWPWSSLPKSWRSRSSGCGRRRRSSSRSCSCLSLRNRPFCPQLHKAGLWAARGCYVTRALGLRDWLHLACAQRTAAAPFFTQRCRTRDPRSIHNTPQWRDWGPAGHISRLRGGEHRHFPWAVLACRSHFYYQL